MLSILLVLGLLQLSSVHAWTTYVVPHTDKADDTLALQAALNSANYTSNATILFQKGVYYNIFSPITFPELMNVEVSIQGNLSYPTNISAVQAAVTSSSYGGAWFTFKGGSNVTLRGSTDPSWGWVDAHGQAWWDAVEETNRPHGFAFSKITNGLITDMKVWKPIGWNFATSGASNVVISNNKILAASDTSSFPFNTDGFSAGGTNLTFENNHVVNGDDCLTVGNGATNIVFKNSYCENGHGLSIGSLGEGGDVADVENVWIENVIVNNSLYAARFKSWTGGNGLARNITWKNIAFESVMFPIYITQNYWDQDDGPKPNSSSVNNTHVQDFLFRNFSGTIQDTPGYVEGSCVTDPCWYAVTNATGKEVVILDLYPDTATNIVAKDITATTLTGSPITVMCNSSTISTDVGFKCWDGLFIPTKAGL